MPIKTKQIKKTFFKTIFRLIILILFFIYIFIGKPYYTIINKVSNITLPIMSYIGKIIVFPITYVKENINLIRESDKIKKDNEKLKSEIFELKSKIKEYNIFEIENKNLLKKLQILKEIKIESTIASVILYNNELMNNFIINKGKNNDIKIGMPVLSMEKQLLGIISEVFDNYSKVKTLSNKDTKIPFRIVGTDIYGFLEGNNSIFSKIGFFSIPNFKPEKNSIIVSSNIGGILPENIFIGKITNEKEAKILNNIQTENIIILKYNKTKL